MERPEISYRNAVFDTKQFYTDKERQRIKNEWIEYIDSKYTVGYSEENTCTQTQSGSFHHFGIHPKVASIYGEKPENILKCKITIVDDHINLRNTYKSEGYDENCIDYFGWISYDDNDDCKRRISLIRENIKVFGIQFSGGGDNEVKCGSGKIVRVKVELI